MCRANDLSLAGLTGAKNCDIIDIDSLRASLPLVFHLSQENSGKRAVFVYRRRAPAKARAHADLAQPHSYAPLRRQSSTCVARTRDGRVGKSVLGGPSGTAGCGLPAKGRKQGRVSNWGALLLQLTVKVYHEIYLEPINSTIILEGICTNQTGLRTVFYEVGSRKPPPFSRKTGSCAPGRDPGHRQGGAHYPE
jgi:hypothetical protein